MPDYVPHLLNHSSPCSHTGWVPHPLLIGMISLKLYPNISSQKAFMYISFFILNYVFLPDSLLGFLSHHIIITHLFHPHKLSIDALSSFLYSCKWVHCKAVSTFGSLRAVYSGLFPTACETARMLGLKLLSTWPGRVDLWSSSWGGLRLKTWAMVARNLFISSYVSHFLCCFLAFSLNISLKKCPRQTYLPNISFDLSYLGYPFHSFITSQPLLLLAPCF